MGKFEIMSLLLPIGDLGPQRFYHGGNTEKENSGYVVFISTDRLENKVVVRGRRYSTLIYNMLLYRYLKTTRMVFSPPRIFPSWILHPHYTRPSPQGRLPVCMAPCSVPCSVQLCAWHPALNHAACSCVHGTMLCTMQGAPVCMAPCSEPCSVLLCAWHPALHHAACTCVHGTLPCTMHQAPVCIAPCSAPCIVHMCAWYPALRHAPCTCVHSSLGRYVFGSEISYNKAPPRLPGLGC